MTEREAKSAIASIAFDSITENSVLRSKLANVHEKLLAIEYELEASATYRGGKPFVEYARALVKEALDITQVKEKQCKNQLKK